MDMRDLVVDEVGVVDAKVVGSLEIRSAMKRGRGWEVLSFIHSDGERVCCPTAVDLIKGGGDMSDAKSATLMSEGLFIAKRKQQRLVLFLCCCTYRRSCIRLASRIR